MRLPFEFDSVLLGPRMEGVPRRLWSNGGRMKTLPVWAYGSYGRLRSNVHKLSLQAARATVGSDASGSGTE